MEAIFGVNDVIHALQLILGGITHLTNTNSYYHDQATVFDGKSYDFIIVGAGSAGCVLANRLSETNCSVLLIEAGGCETLTSDAPGLFPLIASSPQDWNYTATYDFNTTYETNTTLERRRYLHQIRGKMLGGTSSANWMLYIRGNRADYDGWVEEGNEGWGYEDVLPYFVKSEGFKGECMPNNSAELLGTDGYLGVTNHLWNSTDEYLRAFQEAGHTLLDDPNGYQQLGYTKAFLTIDDSKRQSTAVAYLRPIKNRPNLNILKNSLVTKIILEDNEGVPTATGVEVKLSNQKTVKLMAQKEVIISAGAINSPQLLMLSGIGPKEHLEEMGIPVIVDSPKVGQNLHDHMLAMIALSGAKANLMNVTDYNVNHFADVFKFPSPTVMGHVAMNKSQNYPDYQITMFPFSTGGLMPTVLCLHLFKQDKDICESLEKARHQSDVLLTGVSFLHPKSRGQIKLKSNNPEEHPNIDCAYYSHPDDLDLHASYIEDFLKILETSYFKDEMCSELIDMNVRECEEVDFRSHEYWKCFLTLMVQTHFHVSGTCAMGTVVDDELRVHGVNFLRVVDASIIPTTLSGNTNAPVIMIAEKAADMIKDDNNICECANR